MKEVKTNKIIVRTPYKRSLNYRFYMFYMFTSTYSPYLILISAGVISTLAIMNSFNTKTSMQSLIISWVLAGFCIMMIPLLLILRLNDIVKQETPELKKSVDTIEITRHKIVRNNSALEGKLTLSWNQLKVIFETKKYFYFYTKEKNGLILVKKDILEGDVETLRKLIKENGPLNKRGKIAFKKLCKEKHGNTDN